MPYKNLHIDPQTHKRLKMAAASQGITIKELLRRLSQTL